jgi:hypothetical protein
MINNTLTNVSYLNSKTYSNIEMQKSIDKIESQFRMNRLNIGIV